MVRSVSALVRYNVRRPSRRCVTRPTFQSTCRCFETEGCSSSSASAISLTDRSSDAMSSRMCRRRGSATALKGSEVVAARGMLLIYSYIGICQAAGRLVGFVGRLIEDAERRGRPYHGTVLEWSAVPCGQL